MVDPGHPFKLDVHVTQEGYGWGLWQWQECLWSPVGFWSQLWRAAEVCYSLIEKQLAAVYTALVVTVAITGTARVLVRTTNPVQGWVHLWNQGPKTGVAQTTTLAKWGAYLEQCSTLSSSPLSTELQQVLGPVELVAQAEPSTLPMGEDLEASSCREEQSPVPEDAWYTDGSSRGAAAVWTAIGVQPKTDTIWFDTGIGQSSQWAELRAVWMVINHEPGPLVICTDNWVVFQGPMLWLPTWKHQK